MSQNSSDVATSKVLKRKVPDSEEKAEHSKAKSLKSKPEKKRLPGASESTKAVDEKKANETDAKEFPNTEAGPASKASTTSSGGVIFPAMGSCVDCPQL